MNDNAFQINFKLDEYIFSIFHIYNKNSAK